MICKCPEINILLKLVEEGGNTILESVSNWTPLNLYISMKKPLETKLKEKISNEIPSLLYWSAGGSPFDKPAEGFKCREHKVLISFPNLFPFERNFYDRVLPIKSLETYYSANFQENDYPHEVFKKIDSYHGISSDYYDVLFNRRELVYRDKKNIIDLSIDDLGYSLTVYLFTYFKHIKCPMSKNILQNRIGTMLNFLDVKFEYF